MTYRDFSFLLSFVKYKIFGTITYWGKYFLLRVQEETVLGIDDADATRYHCFLEDIYELNVSIGLDPKIEMENISVSISPICMILSSLDLSKLVLSESGEKMVISVTNQLFTLSMSYKGQIKVKEKCCLKSL